MLTVPPLRQEVARGEGFDGRLRPESEFFEYVARAYRCFLAGDDPGAEAADAEQAAAFDARSADVVERNRCLEQARLASIFTTAAIRIVGALSRLTRCSADVVERNRCLAGAACIHVRNCSHTDGWGVLKVCFLTHSGHSTLLRTQQRPCASAVGMCSTKVLLRFKSAGLAVLSCPQLTV